MGKNGVTGIIIPMGREAVHNIVHHRVLYVGEKSDDWDLIEEGDRVFLYDSEVSKQLEGEAKIRRIYTEKGEDLLKNLDRLCQTEQEVRSHAARATEDEFPVIEVEGAVKYSRGIICPFNVPPGGLKVTEEVSSGIFHANS